MMKKALVLLFCSLFLQLLVSCVPPPVDPDEQASPGTDAAAGNDPGAITEGNLSQGPGQSLAPGLGQGSLEALKQGTPPAEGVLADVYFAFDRSELEAEARDLLQRNSDWIKQNPEVSIEIEGHADNRGTNEYNLALGARRAQAVKDYLVTLGNAPDRLSTISYGEELPVCGVDTEECWHKNRRAHFVVRAQKPAS
ncbi:MAG: peptidoglycan-associated lipoprotein Pal [Deltaproteobacteria bacterium]|nr:peptidoglycan-associated lipoprotein Pal [Deltaproteobacteria bacterium]